MTVTPLSGPALALALFVLTSPSAGAVELAFAAPVEASISSADNPGSHALAIGPFADGAVPVRVAHGAVDRRAWQLQAKGLSTEALMEPLAAQLAAQGFTPVFACEARRCGGFDFRFGIEVLPEPGMHVDLGDYRYLAAERGSEVVGLLVSRSSGAGFVQLIRVAGEPLPAVAGAEKLPDAAEPPDAAEQPDLPEPEVPDAPVARLPDADATGLAAQLVANGVVALDDLVFASGAAALAEGDYASLAALAEWLKADPARSVALVGHTDASGGLKANVGLSKKRAEGVRQVLMMRYDVAPGQVVAEGVGPLSPRASNLTDAGRQKNRRVEAVMTSTQ